MNKTRSVLLGRMCERDTVVDAAEKHFDALAVVLEYSTVHITRTDVLPVHPSV